MAAKIPSPEQTKNVGLVTKEQKKFDKIKAKEEKKRLRPKKFYKNEKYPESIYQVLIFALGCIQSLDLEI